MTVRLEGGDAVEADTVLVAIGRRPNVEGIGLEDLGVEMTENGFVQIDDHCRTNVPWLYAIGDVNGTAQLAHVASHRCGSIGSRSPRTV